jgi:hypothetical protein
MDQVIEYQINHLCVSKRFRRSLQDVGVTRRAYVSIDHHLLTAKIKLKLRGIPMELTTREKYNVCSLKDQHAKNSFILTLKMFHVLQDMLTETTEWEEAMNAIRTKCKKELGPNTT